MSSYVFLLRCSIPLAISVSVLRGVPAIGQELRVSGSDCAALLSAPADLPGWGEAVTVPLSVELGRRMGVPRGVTADVSLGAIIAGRATAPPPEVLAAIRRACAGRRDLWRGSGTRDVLRGD